MFHRAFWTERRFTGLLLMLGFLLYVAAVASMPRDAGAGPCGPRPGPAGGPTTGEART